jgi:hypothetical protein
MEPERAETDQRFPFSRKARQDRKEQQLRCFAVPLRPLRSLRDKNALFHLAEIAKAAKNNNYVVLLFLCVLCDLCEIETFCFAVYSSVSALLSWRLGERNIASARLDGV